MTTPRRPDWLRAILRPEPPPDDDTEPAGTPSFDGGTRTTIPAPAPTMSQLIRRARHGGDLAGQHQPPDDDAA